VGSTAVLCAREIGSPLSHVTSPYRLNCCPSAFPGKYFAVSDRPVLLSVSVLMHSIQLAVRQQNVMEDAMYERRKIHFRSQRLCVPNAQVVDAEDSDSLSQFVFTYHRTIDG
jgi:hypothetical protein